MVMAMMMASPTTTSTALLGTATYSNHGRSSLTEPPTDQAPIVSVYATGEPTLTPTMSAQRSPAAPQDPTAASTDHPSLAVIGSWLRRRQRRYPATSATTVNGNAIALDRPISSAHTAAKIQLSLLTAHRKPHSSRIARLSV